MSIYLFHNFTHQCSRNSLFPKGGSGVGLIDLFGIVSTPWLQGGLVIFRNFPLGGRGLGNFWSAGGAAPLGLNPLTDPLFKGVKI